MQLFPDSLLNISKPLPGDVQRYSISTGYRGTAQTIEKMRQCVAWGKRWPGTRRIVSPIIASCSRKNYKCMVEALFNHVQSFHYVFDPSGIECIQGIDETERLRMGDCDDFSVWLATTLESIGIPCYFKTLKAKPGSDEFTHVYTVAVVPGIGKFPLDATMPSPAGWEAGSGKFPCKLWPSSSDEMEFHGGGENSSMSGLDELPLATMDGLECCCENADVGLSGLYGDDDGCETAAAPLSGLGGATEELAVSSVIDGTAYANLRQAKDESNQRAVQAGQLLMAARSSGSSQAMQLAEQAQAAVAKERQSLFDAINAYSKLANDIQTYSMGAYRPQQLSGLGIGPVLVGIAVIAAAAYVAAQAFSIAWATYQGNANAAKSYIQQAQDAITATGHAAVDTGGAFATVAEAATKSISTIAIVGIIGLAAFVGFKALKKSGKI